MPNEEPLTEMSFTNTFTSFEQSTPKLMCRDQQTGPTNILPVSPENVDYDCLFLRDENDDAPLYNQISPLLLSTSTSPSLSSSIAIPPAPTVPVSAGGVINQPTSSTSILPHSEAHDLSESRFPVPPPEIEKGEVRTEIIDANDLNFADRWELIRERQHLDPIRNDLLRILENKRADYSDGIPNAYFDNGYLILGLASEDYARRYICCGRPALKGNVTCKSMFCETCAHRNRDVAFARYAHIFHKGTFHYLTFTFHGNLPFDVITSTQLLGYWEAIESGHSGQVCFQGLEWCSLG